MKTLFLDIASHAGHIACVTDDATVALTPIDHRINDSALMPAVESTLKAAGWNYKDLTNIAVIVGPGGFTSLRMGVTLANVLADQLKIPATGIHLSDVYHARSGDGVAWMHSTKKGALFIRTFGIKKSVRNEPTFISIEELQANSQLLQATFCGELIPEHRAVIDQLGIQEASLRPIDEILPAFLKTQSYSSDAVLPWYGRGW